MNNDQATLDLNLNANAKLSGEYKLVIKHADGSETDTGWFPNLILNSGLDLIGHGTASSYGVVGTGTSTPIAAQTQLDAKIGSYGNFVYIGTSVSTGSPAYIRTLTDAYQWAQGGIVGTISEIGIGPNTTGLGLFSRALILDSLGSPTTISLISTDQLTAYYALTITPPVTDTTGSFVVAGVTYTYTMRLATAANFASYPYLVINGSLPSLGQATAYGSDAVLGAITGQPTATSAASIIGSGFLLILLGLAL